MVADVPGGFAKDQALLVGRQRRGGQVRHPHRFARWGRKSSSQEAAGQRSSRARARRSSTFAKGGLLGHPRVTVRGALCGITRGRPERPESRFDFAAVHGGSRAISRRVQFRLRPFPACVLALRPPAPLEERSSHPPAPLGGRTPHASSNESSCSGDTSLPQNPNSTAVGPQVNRSAADIPLEGWIVSR